MHNITEIVKIGIVVFVVCTFMFLVIAPLFK